MRINVTGNAGAGKSTLAKHIAQTLDIPLIEMDSLLWLPGWEKRSPEELRDILFPLLQQEAWVLDGVSKLVREHADHIIFLDVPRRVCAWRCMKRNWKFLFRSRPGLPEHCPEWRIIPTLYRIIRDFPKNVRHAILADIHSETSTHLILSSESPHDSLEMFLDQLK